MLEFALGRIIVQLLVRSWQEYRCPMAVDTRVRRQSGHLEWGLQKKEWAWTLNEGITQTNCCMRMEDYERSCYFVLI